MCIYIITKCVKQYHVVIISNLNYIVNNINSLPSPQAMLKEGKYKSKRYCTIVIIIMCTILSFIFYLDKKKKLM